jgi:DNA repair exonuclease SbcCD ATPase subunit
LTARGLALPATLTCLIIPVEAQASLLAGLIATSLATARMVSTGTLSGSGAIPAHVTAWSKGAVRAMFLSKVQVITTLILAFLVVGAGGTVVWQRVQAKDPGTLLAEELAANAPAKPQAKPKVSRPPEEPKPAVDQKAAELEVELAKAETDLEQLQAHWDQKMAELQQKLWQEQKEKRVRKVRLTFEARRIRRELEMAESRYEKLTQALDMGVEGAAGTERLEKKQQEVQKQAQQLSAKLLEYEMQLAELEEPVSNDKSIIESVERQRARQVAQARKRIDALERKLHPAANADPAKRVQELERKIDALTQAVEDLRKTIRR